MTHNNLRRASFALVVLLASAPAPAQTSGKKLAPSSHPGPANAEQQQDAAAADLRAIKRPQLPEFHPQQPKRIVLENGMVVFLQEDHELPLINGFAYIRGGSKGEPEGKVGLAQIYAGAWRTGGTSTKTGDQLDDELEARAARIETSGGLDTTVVTLSCLKDDFDFVLNDFNDILRHPEFREDKIVIAKNRVKTGIARRNDDIGQIAGRESTKLGYGADSPYARVPEYATIGAVTRQDLIDWHSKYVHPNDIILGIVGDFDSAAMEAKLRKEFDGWDKGPAYASSQIAIAAPKPGVYFIEKNDVNQSEIRMVALGLRRDDPDFYAVQVMNQILGGGFSSRLFRKLRTEAGLAYAVGGSVNAPFDHIGLTRLSIGTKSGTTVQAIDGLYKQIEEMHNVPVTEAEMQRGKDAILNSFVFQFDSKEEVMRERMTYELYGYPADFLDRYQKGVEKVTAEDVNRVARKYLVQDKFAVLVVGKSEDFDKPLTARGPVTNIDITIPQPDAGGASASASVSNAEGKALIARVIKAAGGMDKLNAIKTIRTKAKLTLQAQGGMTVDAEETQLLPDKVHTSMSTGAGELVMVVTPKDSFMDIPSVGPKALPSFQRDDQLTAVRRNVWYVAQHLNDPRYTFSAQGTEKVGDVQASVLDIHDEGQQWRWYVDPQSGYILRARFQSTGASGPGTRVVNFSEWKTTDGITMPFHEELITDGQPTGTVEIGSYEFNPAVDPTIFENPGEKDSTSK